jgi:DNA-binding response OmpR family regulator
VKILGIDDNEEINKLFQIAFISSGHEYDYTLSSREGLRLIRENRYDLVLLDLAMPDFSGKDLLESLHREGLSGKQKIIIVTASATIDKDLDQFKDIGVSDCIRKPVDLDFLLARAEEIIA